MRKLATAATLFTLVLSGCGVSPLAAHSVATNSLAAKTVATKAAPAAAGTGNWEFNDGMIPNADEQRVFDLLSKVLTAAPAAAPAYSNYISDLNVRRGSDGRFLTFSGVRLIRQSLFVPNAPSLEFFFEGTLDTQTGETTIYRQTKMDSAKS